MRKYGHSGNLQDVKIQGRSWLSGEDGKKKRKLARLMEKLKLKYSGTEE